MSHETNQFEFSLLANNKNALKNNLKDISPPFCKHVFNQLMLGRFCVWVAEEEAANITYDKGELTRYATGWYIDRGE